jgi:DNA repair protein RecO (recombination protein O)
MTAKRCEGIILQTLKYKDYDQIATVFTQDQGIQKFFVKGAYRNQSATPLARAEFIYFQGKSTMYSCKEVSLLNTYLSLRNDLTQLETATELLKAVLESQMENKPAPDLYKLLIVYLEKIQVMPDPWVLAASFHLKVLRHDGLLAFEQPNATEEERLLIQLLAFTRSLADLASVQISPAFYQKVKTQFKEALTR